MRKFAAAAAALLMMAACGGDRSSGEENRQSAEPAAKAETRAATVDEIAESFVKLALATGQHDKAFVDAYHGPKEWADAAEAGKRDLQSLEAEARSLIDALDKADGSPGTRRAMLRKNLTAALTRIRMARGETFTFDEETELLYDAKAPEYSLEEFDTALADIETIIPGDDPLPERVDAFRTSLAIPSDKLDAVFKAAMEECRKRTRARYALPDNERFTIGYVTDKPWSGYNWYQGDYESLIEVNTDLPVIIDRAVDLGCHEGYPGHHTWNVMIERDLLQANEWIEYAVYPLFSPQSLIAEGSANYGIELAFPGDEKITFEREVLFPMAGLDPALAETLAALNKAQRKLSHSRNHIARLYLDGDISREEAIELIMKYSLVSRERAEKSVRFIDTYRGYVINYNLGRDLVQAYVEREVAGGADPWEAFESILIKPTAASDLIASGE